MVTAISASDPNSNSLTYNIMAGNDEDRFSIDIDSGQLTIALTLDYEETNFYTLTVIAFDGVEYVEGTVTVKVTDINENGDSGGCTMHPGAGFDPVIPLLLLLSVLYLSQRSRYRK